MAPTRVEYEQRLLSLAASARPRDLSCGACCYAPAPPLILSDYVCPRCGERGVLSIQEYPQLAHELDACRELLSEIKGLRVELLETGFCTACFPNAQGGSLDLVVHHDHKTSHRANGINSNDLVLITEFLAGETKHEGYCGEETPLQKHIPRLRQLLGLPEKTK
jgi:hypothetical protein